MRSSSFSPHMYRSRPAEHWTAKHAATASSDAIKFQPSCARDRVRAFFFTSEIPSVRFFSLKTHPKPSHEMKGARVRLRSRLSLTYRDATRSWNVFRMKHRGWEVAMVSIGCKVMYTSSAMSCMLERRVAASTQRSVEVVGIHAFGNSFFLFRFVAWRKWPAKALCGGCWYSHNVEAWPAVTQHVNRRNSKRSICCWGKSTFKQWRHTHILIMIKKMTTADNVHIFLC